MTFPTSMTVQVPNSVVSSSGWTVGAGRGGTLSDQIAEGHNYDGDGSFDLATVSGSQMILSMFDTYRVPDTTISEIKVGVVARVSGTGQSATIAVDLYKSDGSAAVNVITALLSGATTYTTLSYDAQASPFAGMLPRLQLDRLWDPNMAANVQWYARVRCAGISGGALLVTALWFDVYFPGYSALSGPVTDSGHGADTAVGYIAGVVTDSGAAADSGTGYVVKSVSDSGQGVDVASLQILYRGAIRTGGTPPNRTGGGLPRQM